VSWRAGAPADPVQATAPIRVEVATVAKAHGIRGELLAVSFDPGSETLGLVDAVWIGDAATPWSARARSAARTSWPSRA
jgi:hypothetical protein